MTLLALRTKGALNSLARRPLRYLFAAAILALLYWGVFAVTRRSVAFLDGYPAIDGIADAVAQRSLEALFLILMFGVAFTVLTTAIATLYSSEDLPFLLSLPVRPAHVFYLKTFEVYVGATLLPAVFTLPVLIGLGIERAAPPSYYPVALAALLALYAIPVAIGGLMALVLMRVSPAGRVKEIATALSVVLAAAVILGLRALRPEQIAELTPEEFEAFLATLASFDAGWLPPSWASHAVWGALDGRLAPGAFLLAACSLVLLFLVARISAFAYQVGWVRSLESTGPRLDRRPRPAAWWERLLYRLGSTGSIVAKDLRLLVRDPAQWSQLLVLLALAGVYLVSVGSVTVELQRFKDAVGTLNLAFLGFLLAGVGVRTAFPIVSLEGEGYWLLKAAPVRSLQVVLAKFWGAVPAMALLGAGLGMLAAHLIDVSPTLAVASPVAGLAAAVACTALGVGLGAAFPRFDATSPSEIPLSPGGLLYMTLSLGYAAFLTVALAYPAWRALTDPELLFWSRPEGLMTLAAVTVSTLLVSGLALLFGSRRLAAYEPGD